MTKIKISNEPEMTLRDVDWHKSFAAFSSAFCLAVEPAGSIDFGVHELGKQFELEIIVSNTCDVERWVEISAGVSWLEVTPQKGYRVPAHENYAFTLVGKCSQSGSYDGTISISDKETTYTKKVCVEILPPTV